MKPRGHGLNKRAKPRDLESPIQRAIIAYLGYALPGAIVHHSQNEFGMSGDGIARQIAKAKHNGMLPGFPDLVVFSAHGVALVEVKAPKGRLTDMQADLADRFLDMGHNYATVRSVDDMAAALATWGWPNACPLRGVVS